MKVGIMTLFQNYNYGAALQAYALQRVIRDSGYDVETIQYTRTAVDTNKRDYVGELFRGCGRRIIRIFLPPKQEFFFSNHSLVRKHLFDEFIGSQMKVSKIQYTKQDIVESNLIYDTFECGSDNIWNKNLYDSSFMLDFVSDDKRKIAYAPGMSTDSLTLAQRKLFIEPISRIQYISCREKIGAIVLEKCMNVEVPVVCDPTLLISVEKWREIEREPYYDLPEKYIFTYICGRNQLTEKAVQDLQSKTGLPVIVIPDMSENYNFKCDKYDYLSDIGPAEFLYLVDHSTFVVTDSFHGTVFSCLFKKEFFSFDRFFGKYTVHLNQRIYNLLNVLNISSDRIIREENIKGTSKNSSNTWVFMI